MALLTWNDSYSVGVKMLDDQHKGLVSVLNELHAAMMGGKAKDITGPLLRSLVKYTEQHFTAEEALLTRSNYPRLAEHKTHHQGLTRQVLEFAGRFERGEISLTVQLLTFLRDWLTNHILKEDHQYGPWLNQHGIR